jgi:hypothetical protein
MEKQKTRKRSGRSRGSARSNWGRVIKEAFMRRNALRLLVTASA